MMLGEEKEKLLRKHKQKRDPTDGLINFSWAAWPVPFRFSALRNP